MDAISFGEVLWDVSGDVRTLGGAPLNFAYFCSKNGLPSCVISAVGDDALGGEAIAEMERRGISPKFVRVVPGHSTGVAAVSEGKDGKPHYEIAENSAWDFISLPEDIKGLSKECGIFAFGSLSQRGNFSRDSLRKILEILPESCLKVFDANLRQKYYNREVLEYSLNKCDMLKLNDEELVIFAKLFAGGAEDPAKRIVEKFNLKYLVLTLGAKGYRVISQDSDFRGAAEKTKVVDTVGAGDSFTATFASSIAKGDSAEDAARAANKVAARVCSARGAMCL